jgi:phospholipid/cholesterol/gamma-HCH transport system substrate-binding protein
MARRDNALAVTAPLIKSIIFAVVGILILAVLWIQFGQIQFNKSKTYSAIFTSTSGMQPASSVTANGIQVGRVDDIKLINDKQALVIFTIDASVPLTTTTQARIRYKDLTGDQYLDLTPAPGSNPGQPLADGATIPVSQTSPALDLDVLLNGFNPLLQGLQPDQVNQLSGELVSVLQGEGGTINSVLAHAASFSGSLANQDHLIGSVINNLNTVLGGLDSHSAQLSDTVLQAQQVISKANRDRKDIYHGLDDLAGTTKHLGDVAKAARTTHDTLIELGRTAKIFADSSGEFNRILRLLPGAYLRLGRVSTGGAGYDFEVCGVVLRLTGPDGKPYFTPQIGPSDNNLQCSRNDVAPLQGEAPTSAKGPAVTPLAPPDGQALAGDANEQGYVEQHKKNPGENPRNGG